MRSDPPHGPEITLTKMDAARRQLGTAIELWFNDGDPVSIHTLACASYEMIHVLSRHKGRKEGLLFDSLLVRDEYRAEMNRKAKEHANFFKHANKDADREVVFRPRLSDTFIVFSIIGLEACGLNKNAKESAFIWWLSLAMPNLCTEDWQRVFAENVSVDDRENALSLGKAKFFHHFVEAHHLREVI